MIVLILIVSGIICITGYVLGYARGYGEGYYDSERGITGV